MLSNWDLRPKVEQEHFEKENWKIDFQNEVGISHF